LFTLTLWYRTRARVGQAATTPRREPKRRKAIADTGTIPAPDPAVFGLSGADHAWVARRQTPHPGGVYDEALTFNAKRLAALPKTFIDCTAPPLATITVPRMRVRSEPVGRSSK